MYQPGLLSSALYPSSSINNVDVECHEDYKDLLLKDFDCCNSHCSNQSHINMPATTSVTLNTGAIMPTVGLGKSDPSIIIRNVPLIRSCLSSNRYLEVHARPSRTRSGVCVEERIPTHRHRCRLPERDRSRPRHQGIWGSERADFLDDETR